MAGKGGGSGDRDMHSYSTVDAPGRNSGSNAAKPTATYSSLSHFVYNLMWCTKKSSAFLVMKEIYPNEQ